MLGRYTTLVGRIMAAVALFTLLTGASEEYGGIITHVELTRAEHPVPEGYDSWDEVIPSAETGPHYYWAPAGHVLVQRTDGSVVRARNDFDHAGYMSRVSLLQSRSGEWFITAVESRGEGDELYEPGAPEREEEELLIAAGEEPLESTEETATYERTGATLERDSDRERATNESPAARRRQEDYQRWLDSQKKS